MSGCTFFDAMLQSFERDSLGFVLAFITSPYDLAIAEIPRSPKLQNQWQVHVWGELLCSLRDLPYVTSGFSGGAILALAAGLEKQPNCFGGATFGADQLPADFACPSHWKMKLQMYCNAGDPVCRQRDNMNTSRILASRSHAERYAEPNGGHALLDYVQTALPKFIARARQLEFGDDR